MNPSDCLSIAERIWMRGPLRSVNHAHALLNRSFSSRVVGGISSIDTFEGEVHHHETGCRSAREELPSGRSTSISKAPFEVARGYSRCCERRVAAPDQSGVRHGCCRLSRSAAGHELRGKPRPRRAAVSRRQSRRCARLVLRHSGLDTVSKDTGQGPSCGASQAIEQLFLLI